jgi:hypothetical protein
MVILGFYEKQRARRVFMVKIQYKWLLAPTFLEVMRKVAGHAGFPTIKDSYNASKLVEHIESERKTAARMRDQLVEKFTKNGEQNGEETKEGKEALWKEAIDALLAHEVTLEKRSPIKVEHLEGLKLSPIDLLALGSLIDFSGATFELEEVPTSSEPAAPSP